MSEAHDQTPASGPSPSQPQAQEPSRRRVMSPRGRAVWELTAAHRAGEPAGESGRREGWGEADRGLRPAAEWRGVVRHTRREAL